MCSGSGYCPPLCFDDNAGMRQGLGCYLQIYSCSKATGFLLQHPNLLPSAGRALPQTLLQFLNTNCPSHQLGLAGVTRKYQRPCWWVREDPSGACPSNPRGKWNTAPYCFRWLEFQVTTPATDTYACPGYRVAFLCHLKFSVTCHLKIATACACCN